jgi:hypothetical protein
VVLNENVNSKASYPSVLAMYYVDSNENVPIGLIFVNFVQQKVTSIGILKLKLGRASMPKSSTPFVYRGAIVACTI